MASENETFDEVLRCMQNDIVHFVGKPVKHSRDLLQEYHDRFKAAHQREVESYKRLLMTSQYALEDEIVTNQNHQREVAELRECLGQAYGDKIGTYTMKGNEVEWWRKALKGASND